MDNPGSSLVIQRSDGTTASERYLKRLCDRTFLSLWSYSGVFRDQGSGKEVCDLLVVFENHVIIFSDKDCRFPDERDLEIAWGRWYRRAIEASAKQVWGAERWIRAHPDRLFLDAGCTQPFPINLPDPKSTTFHRIVVAHGAADRCANELGGSGSLMIVPRVVGAEHFNDTDIGVTPFAIGQIDPCQGFVHVLDDTTLDLVLGTLDTVSDFVEYLVKKEELILSGKLVTAAGEEELLAFYLQNFDDDNAKGFTLPPTASAFLLDEGLWEEFAQSSKRLNQVKANEVSYVWDILTERFSRHILSGTQYFPSSLSIGEQEPLIRFLARENRMRRRALASQLIDMVHTTPRGMRRTRIGLPWKPSDPYYVFLLLPMLKGHSHEQKRVARSEVLRACCMITKLRLPDAKDIIGIATETTPGDATSEDAIWFDARHWTSELRNEAQRIQAETGFLTELKMFHEVYSEYPDRDDSVSRTYSIAKSRKGRDRNKPCPCGSGMKFKQCCGSYA